MCIFIIITKLVSTLEVTRGQLEKCNAEKGTIGGTLGAVLLAAALTIIVLLIIIGYLKLDNVVHPH